jgi:hypothetical protein
MGVFLNSLVFLFNGILITKHITVLNSHLLTKFLHLLIKAVNCWHKLSILLIKFPYLSFFILIWMFKLRNIIVFGGNLRSHLFYVITKFWLNLFTFLNLIFHFKLSYFNFFYLFLILVPKFNQLWYFFLVCFFDTILDFNCFYIILNFDGLLLDLNLDILQFFFVFPFQLFNFFFILDFQLLQLLSLGMTNSYLVF